VLVVGRDLRAVTAIQQQLIETQQAMERDYWQMRQAETRYRLLFQIATDAVLVVDAASQRVLDANRAAGKLFGHDPEKLVGKPATFGVDTVSRPTVEELLASARVTGRASEVEARLIGVAGEARVSATPFRSEGATLLLMRVRVAGATGALPEPAQPPLATLFERTPDAIVFTDKDGMIASVNPAFLDLVQLANEEGAKNRFLGDWIGRPGSDLPMVLAILRKNGAARLVATLARGEHGQTTEIELSAAMLSNAENEYVGFILRAVERRLPSAAPATSDLAGAVQQLTEQLGRASLPDLVQSTTDLVERHLIAAALDLSGNNRTTAAEILGLSRQSLYVKLRRHRLDSGKKSGD
jgi:transcriptional regulator PpsR